MQRDDLVQQLTALPLADRVVLAQELWQGIAEDLTVAIDDEQRDAVQRALRCDAELTSRAGNGRTHEEVMEVVRRMRG
ncbi:MAG TPA: hypothetical protein VFI31_11180 [Pirellulales bacterium]|nr:hypothetical protein [Pirellulales bacterium]